MAELAPRPAVGASEQVQELAQQIKAAQDPEIQQMTQWAAGGGAPTAMPGATDGSGMAGMDHSGHDMGGIAMSDDDPAEQMQQLQQAWWNRLPDQMWLTMMIAP